jgi:hypothetical protein
MNVIAKDETRHGALSRTIAEWPSHPPSASACIMHWAG